MNKPTHYIAIFGRIFFICLALLFSKAFAAPEDNTLQFMEYLAKEKINLTLAINAGKMSAQPADETALNKEMQENTLLLSLNKSRVMQLEEFLQNQKKQENQYQQKIRQLQQHPVKQTDMNSFQEQLFRLNTLNTVNKKTMELIEENLRLAHEYEKVLLEQKNKQVVWKAKFQLDNVLEKLTEKEAAIGKDLQTIYQRNTAWQQEKSLSLQPQEQAQFDAKILLDNVEVILLQQRMQTAQLEKNLHRADYLVVKNQTVKTLQSMTDTYKQAIEHLNSMEEALQRLIGQLDQDKYLLEEPVLKDRYIELQESVKLRYDWVISQQKILQKNLENNQQKLKKAIATRQSLAEYKPDSWPLIGTQLLQIPSQFYDYLQSLYLKIRDNYLWQDTMPFGLFWMAMILIPAVAFFISRLLRAQTVNRERQRLSGHLYGGFLTIIYRNLPWLTLFALLQVILLISHVPYASYELLTHILLVFLAFKIAILIARLSLMERISDVSGKDVRLYYHLKWLLVSGGWVTGLMIFSHLLPLSPIMQDLFNRLFMIFVLAISLVAWKSRETIPYLLEGLPSYHKRYIRTAVDLLVLLVPWIIFITAVMGLLGYINLAWTISGYLVKSTLVLTGYVLMRGLIFDLLDWISEWMIRSMNNGWLWVEVFLKPADKLFRVLIFLASLFVLFQLFGWLDDAVIINSLKTISFYSIINFPTIHITMMSIIEFTILACLVVWMAKWSREFCYRWLYIKVTDPGIKNSLSVFTQYAVIILGGVLALRVLGIDFTGMSLVLTGLAFGMGFGLRDFASNIVGGLMLLIERPVREGDLITLGEYEGRVAHIGIRSMRVSSWDNMEVLIPNAETFSKPFTNWTHQDTIVRTVVPIKVSRQDDPVVVQQLILDVLAIIPEILPDPPAQVFLKKIDEALIEFEIRYFINVDLHTRFEVRSNVLFAIFAQFKAAGIKAPIPPMQIEVTNEEKQQTLAKPKAKQ